MLDAPNFKQLAFDLLDESHREDRYEYLERQLRTLWNDRGATDRRVVETFLSIVMGPTAAEPYLQPLTGAIRAADQ